MDEFNPMQRLKRRFFAMRNGALADQLRKGGVPHKIIFGINLPQLVEIAAEFDPSAEFAEMLWANSSTRESQLIAPMLYPRAEMDATTAVRWALTAKSVEVIDVLCHRLLRHLPSADRVADELWLADEPIYRYAALRLMLNRFPECLPIITERAEAEAKRNDPLTRRLCRQILDEVQFISEN